MPTSGTTGPPPVLASGHGVGTWWSVQAIGVLAPVRATTARTVRSPLSDMRARQMKAPLAEVVSAL